jgi:hypothetical protein
MLLLSKVSPFKMSADLVPDESTQSKDNSFALLQEFTNAHQINLVLEDTHKQQAIFVSQSNGKTNETDNELIDSVTLLKLVLGADGKLT